MLRSILGIALSIAIAETVGLLGAVATFSSVRDWYPTLDKPWFTPPDWLFGPAWTTLYALMGVAAWLVWREGWEHGPVKLALVLYAVQLALNAAWSPAFFGLRSPLAGLLVILPLWVAIAATLVAFWRVSTPAGALLVPYLGWVTYASALNIAIWRLN